MRASLATAEAAPFKCRLAFLLALSTLGPMNGCQPDICEGDSTLNLTGVEFAEGRFVAWGAWLECNYRGTYSTREPTPAVFTSVDGEQWDEMAIDGLDFVPQDAAGGNGVWFLPSGWRSYLWSDGTEWRLDEFGPRDYRSQVEFENGMFLATGGTDLLHISEDGLIWEDVPIWDEPGRGDAGTLDPDLGYLGWLVSGGNTFLLSFVPDEEESRPLTIARSGDGRSWQVVEIPGQGNSLDVGFAGEQFIVFPHTHDFDDDHNPAEPATSSDPIELCVSADGEGWEVVESEQTVPPSTLAFGNGVYVAPYDYAIYTSEDLRHWDLTRRRNYDGHYEHAEAAFGNGRFVVVPSLPTCLRQLTPRGLG